MFERARAWMRGDDVATYHHVSSSSLEHLLVETKLQQGQASQSLLADTALYRGVQVITDVVASTPWLAMSGGEPALSGLPQAVPAEVAASQPRLLIQPDPFESRDQTVAKFVESLLWHGNAYLLGSLFVGGRPTVVSVLDPNEVTVTESKRERYRAKYEWRGLELVPGVNLWHQRLVTVPGSLVGVSPLSAGMPVIKGNIAADSYGKSMFEDSTIPAGVLTMPGMLTETEAKLLLKQWEEQHRKGRGTGVLSGGAEFSAIQLTPEQAQYLMSRSYGDQEVARLLGIPQWILNAGSPPGSGSALTYQNVSAPFAELLRATLGPTYFRRLEVVFSVLLPRGVTVAFDTNQLTRNVPEQVDAVGSLVRSGFAPEDALRAVGMPPVEHTGLLPVTLRDEENLSDAEV